MLKPTTITLDGIHFTFYFCNYFFIFYLLFFDSSRNIGNLKKLKTGVKTAGEKSLERF